MSKHIRVYIIQKDNVVKLIVHLLVVIKTILAYSLILYELFKIILQCALLEQFLDKKILVKIHGVNNNV